MKQIKTEDAVGAVLCHDITEIVRGVRKGARFRKGHIVKEEDIPVLLSLGKENLYVWENDETMMHENEAAEVLCKLCQNDHMSTTEIKEGKIDFFANTQGIVKINKDLLLKLNLLGEIIVSTIHNNTPVKKGEKIGATRVIPLIIDEKKILEAEKIIKEKIISVEEIKPKKAVLITTGNEVYKGRIKDAFLPVMKEKLEYYGSEIVKQVILPDNKEMITENILKAIEEDKVDMIICTGGMSVDPDDVTPSAIKDCNGEIVTYGAPVLPGAMFLLAYYKNIPILGVPSCAMYSKRTIFDLVLPRILADEKLSFEDIARFGNGGMCLNCEICSFPHCSFGK